MILRTVSLPTEFGAILDIAPINRSLQSDWIVLAGDGQTFQFNARELVELNNSVLTRWCFDDSMLGVL